MPKLDKYLLREFAQSMFASLIVLGLVSLGGVNSRRTPRDVRPRGPALIASIGVEFISRAAVITFVKA